MPSAHFLTADVFTDRAFGGNQLAVFPDAHAIPEELLLPITREFNYSEVTFVYPARDERHTRRVRIFTPGGEIPFAGHPTVGTAFVLFASGELRCACDEATIVLEEGVGPVPVTLRFPPADPSSDADDPRGHPTFAQLAVARLPEASPPRPDARTLADVLSLDADDIMGGDYGAEVVSCGLPFLMVPLRSRDAVRRARVRLDAWERTLRGSAGSEMMVFALGDDAGRATIPRGADVHARVFVPGLSVPEDPATGSACAALGGYLAARTPRDDATLRWTVAQGVEMGRPSRIEVEADKAGGRVTGVRVGGRSVLVSEGRLHFGEREAEV
jgi:trans-2,3-dihydro-3-hydroxyanthranilate isomerase